MARHVPRRHISIGLSLPIALLTAIDAVCPLNVSRSGFIVQILENELLGEPDEN